MKFGFKANGLIGLLLFIGILWAAIYGVTVNGKHHQVRLTHDKGVVIE